MLSSSRAAAVDRSSKTEPNCRMPTPNKNAHEDSDSTFSVQYPVPRMQLLQTNQSYQTVTLEVFISTALKPVCLSVAETSSCRDEVELLTRSERD